MTKPARRFNKEHYLTILLAQFKVVKSTRLESLSYEESGYVFVILGRPSVSQLNFESLPVATFLPKLTYFLHEIDIKARVFNSMLVFPSFFVFFFVDRQLNSEPLPAR